MVGEEQPRIQERAARAGHGNIFENNWAAAQFGFAIVLTVRTSDSGNIAVVDDITIENNVLKNVASGFNSVARDDLCKLARAPLCNNPGEAKRWKIANNLIQLRAADAPGGRRPLGFSAFARARRCRVSTQHHRSGDGYKLLGIGLFHGGWRYQVAACGFQHSQYLDHRTTCSAGLPPATMEDRASPGCELYMGDPPPVEKRFAGNVIFVPKDSQPASFPGSNRLVSSGIRFADPAAGDYELVLPKWTKTTDGKPAGVDMKALNAAIAGVASQIY